jgi:hypothetical protein
MNTITSRLGNIFKEFFHNIKGAFGMLRFRLRFFIEETKWLIVLLYKAIFVHRFSRGDIARAKIIQYDYEWLEPIRGAHISEGVDEVYLDEATPDLPKIFQPRKNEKGVILKEFALILGLSAIIALPMLYTAWFNYAKQTGLANQVAQTALHAARHDSAEISDISSKCNENNYNMVMYRPSDHRYGFICDLDGIFVITIKNFDAVNVDNYGDDIVTAFPRKSAKTINDAAGYLADKGYQIFVP